MDLAPASVTLDGRAARGETTEMDRGALLRLTPFGAARNGAERASRVRLDLAGGFSQRNYGDNTISYIDVSQSDPILEERLVGATARLTLRLPGGTEGVWRILTPEINLGAAWDQARYYDGDVRASGKTINRTGQEITILGLVSLRHGFIDDASRIQDDTWGVGAALLSRLFGPLRQGAGNSSDSWIRDRKA